MAEKSTTEEEKSWFANFWHGTKDWFNNGFVGHIFGLDDESEAAEKAGTEKPGFFSRIGHWFNNSLFGSMFGLDDYTKAAEQAGTEKPGFFTRISNWFSGTALGRMFGLYEKPKLITPTQTQSTTPTVVANQTENSTTRSRSKENGRGSTKSTSQAPKSTNKFYTASIDDPFKNNPFTQEIEDNAFVNPLSDTTGLTSIQVNKPSQETTDSLFGVGLSDNTTLTATTVMDSPNNSIDLSLTTITPNLLAGNNKSTAFTLTQPTMDSTGSLAGSFTPTSMSGLSTLTSSNTQNALTLDFSAIASPNTPNTADEQVPLTMQGTSQRLAQFGTIVPEEETKSEHQLLGTNSSTHEF